MTNKFKVGDKVRFVEKFGSYQLGDKVKVTHTEHLFGNEYIHFIGKHGSGNCYSSRLELIQAKPTKNQRISKLEEEVAELRLIVEQISKSSPFVSAASIIAIAKDSIQIRNQSLVDIHKTNNQLRAEIIEKAKVFVEKHDVSNIDFIVNEKYQVVAGVLYDGREVKKASALCHPNDVFNVAIGKAIVVGRLKGLDVSEFEQAVQPDEVVDYMKIDTEKGIYTVTPGDEYEYGHGTGECQANSPLAKNCVIINDTNAIYETAVSE